MPADGFIEPAPLSHASEDAPGTQKPKRESSTLGILGLCFFWIPIVGLVLGIVSLATRERRKALGILAVILSVLGPILLVALGILSAIALPKFGAVRQAAEEASCRSNMRSLATAEAMFYGMNNDYAAIDELASSGIMDTADDMVCPTADGGYIVNVSRTSYTIRCSEGSHGSVVDGECSWMN